jgi:hypothetical protein
MSSFLLMGILYDAIVALVVNLVLALFFYFFARNGLELYESLHVAEVEATTNSFIR